MADSPLGRTAVNTTPAITAIEEIADWFNEGKLVPFIGAGASQRRDGNCPPTGAELRQFIARKLKYTSNGNQPLGDVPLSTMAQHFELQNGRPALIELLKNEIDNETYEPSPLQTGLAKIAKKIPRVQLIVTTNYDSLLERALGPPVSKKGDILVQFPHRPNDQLDYEFGEDSVAVYKLHGSFDQLGSRNDRDSLVITDDDYIEFLTAMQDRNFIPRTILTHIANRHMLFLGYGLRDWDFMVLYRSVVESKNKTKINPSYTIQRPFVARGSDADYWRQYWDNTKGYWNKKEILTLEMDQEEFLEALLAKLKV